MGFQVVIPARYGSTRLPGKPLLDIAGKPLIQHVYERAVESDADAVVVATDDDRIRACAESFGASVCMTSTLHRSGTDRLAEVVRARELDGDEIIVNVQGDEPMMAPALINQVARLLAADERASMSTLCEPILERSTLGDPSVVKVVFDCDGLALYFSRAPIPWHRDAFSSDDTSMPEQTPFFRHLGIYAYRVGFLLEFVESEPSPLELAESLEQLRAMHYGHSIAVAEGVESTGPGVDTQADLERVERLLGAGAQ